MAALPRDMPKELHLSENPSRALQGTIRALAIAGSGIPFKAIDRQLVEITVLFLDCKYLGKSLWIWLRLNDRSSLPTDN